MESVTNVEVDRLSSLSDDLIHKILSFIDTKHAIKTSALSSRWRYIWTSMPSLNFSSDDCYTEFVTNVLSNRNKQIEVFSTRLTFRENVRPEFIKTILDYALSHNVQQLNITCLQELRIKIPQSILSSPSLKHLTLSGNGNIYDYSIKIPAAFDLPALTTLNLHCVTLDDDNLENRGSLFSNCANLKNLRLKNCRTKSCYGFTIRHPELISLTLEDGRSVVYVITPQLKNLVIKNWEYRYRISAPNLCYVRYKNYSDPMTFPANLLYLEKVDICISYPVDDELDALNIVSMLQQLHRVKYLTLNIEIIKLLSSYRGLISRDRSPFVNLRSLIIYPDYANLKEQTPREIFMSPKVRSFLLDSSPDAVFTVVSHEENTAILNVASARNLMGELQVVLNQLKENSDLNATHMKTRMNEQLEKGYKSHNCVISMLQEIKGVLAKLPLMHRGMLLARFYRLRAEVDSMMDRMKIQCDTSIERMT